MTHPSCQHGYVSEAIHTSRGVCYQIRYRVRNDDGTCTHKSERLYGLAGQKAARAILEQRLRLAADADSPSPNQRVVDFVDGYWLPYRERQGIRASTCRSYDSMLRNVLPPISWRALTKITPLHIEEIVQQRSRQASPKTVQNEVRLLHSIFGLAVDYGLLERNPVLPKHQPRVIAKEKPIWTPAQIASILAALPEEHRPLFTLIACTGLRVGEALALTWDDIDCKQQAIRVRKSLDGKQLLRPKTAAGSRVLPVGPQLLQMLAEHRGRTRPASLSSWVFVGREGQSLNPDMLRRDVLYPVLDRLQLPRPPRGAAFHCFRHSLGSLVNAQSGNLKLVQTLLGHSTLATTANVYTHTASAEVRAAALAVERAILGGGSSNVPQEEQSAEPAAPPPAQNLAPDGVKAKRKRIRLDIARESCGEQPAAPATPPPVRNLAQRGGKTKITRIPLREVAPPPRGEPVEAPAAASQPETENPVQARIARLRLEAFLSGGPCFI